MAVKTWASGEVLTASDLNTYAGNPGLVFVASASFSNQSFVEITGLSNAYLRYHLSLSIGRHTGSGTNGLEATFRNGATVYNTAYYGASFYALYNGSSGVTGARNAGTAAYMGNAGSTTQNLLTASICGTASGQRPTISGHYYDYFDNGNLTFGYIHDASVTIDRIRITPNSANITGSWSLYGYRVA